MNKNHNPSTGKSDNPNYLLRSPKHDYKRRAYYMLTLSKAQSIPSLSIISGDLRETNPDNPNFPKAQHLPEAQFFELAILDWLQKFPEIRVNRMVIMPDHIHISINVVKELPIDLNRAVSWLMARTSRLRHEASLKINPHTQFVSFFEKGFNDKIASNPSQWHRQNLVIDQNPRRFLMKRAFPDLYLKNWIITLGKRKFKARGNILLLKSIQLLTVRWSSKYSPERWQQHLIDCDDCIRNGGVLLSPFINPNELLIRNKALENGAPVIRICENGLPDKFQPTAEEADYAGTCKLLLIAPYGPPSPNPGGLRQKAMAMNKLAEELTAINWFECNASIRPES